MPPGPERRRVGRALVPLAADKAPWIVFLTRNNLNLTSERFGGYHYDAVKTISLGLAYVQDESTSEGAEPRPHGAAKRLKGTAKRRRGNLGGETPL